MPSHSSTSSTSSPFAPTPPGATILPGPHNVPIARGYSHVVTTSTSFSSSSNPAPTQNRLISIAGQVGTDINGNTPSDPQQQIQGAFSNLGQALSSAGALVQDILSLRVYIVHYDPAQKRQTFHRPLAEFLKGHKPAITLVPVPALASAGVVFEVEATANIPVHPTEEVEVVVVGAGLSGLKAAWDLQRSLPGARVVVLEARDRVGGKTWSRETGIESTSPKASGKVRGGGEESGKGKGEAKTSKVDVGAAWFNDTNQSYIWALVKHFGLEKQCVVQNTQGNMSIENSDKGYETAPYGGVLQDKQWQENVVGMRMFLEELCQKIDIRRPVESAAATRLDLDSMTLEELVRRENGSEQAMDMLKISTRALLGAEPSDMSALYFLDYCKSAGGLLSMRSDGKDGGQYLRLVPGVQEFSKLIANELAPNSIYLNSPVREIRQTDTHVFVDSARASFKCKRVVISIPTPMYKEITFSPPLPPEKVKLSQSTKLGCYGKAICVYQKPWWREGGLCGLLQSSTGPAGVFRDTSVDEEGQFSLTCFMVGEPARRWGELPRADRDKAVLEQIKNGFGKLAKVEQPLEIIEQEWMKEQWSQGCPCPVMPPGIMTELGHALRSSVGRMHFVGTETAYEWKGYMDGAVRSGERGAKEVLQKLQAAKL